MGGGGQREDVEGGGVEWRRHQGLRWAKRMVACRTPDVCQPCYWLPRYRVNAPDTGCVKVKTKKFNNRQPMMNYGNLSEKVKTSLNADILSTIDKRLVPYINKLTVYVTNRWPSMVRIVVVVDVVFYVIPEPQRFECRCNPFLANPSERDTALV